jgi:hypothetical protein
VYRRKGDEQTNEPPSPFPVILIIFYAYHICSPTHCKAHFIGEDEFQITDGQIGLRVTNQVRNVVPLDRKQFF